MNEQEFDASLPPRPPVVLWAQVVTLLLAIMQLGLVVGGIWLRNNREWLMAQTDDPKEIATVVDMYGVILPTMGGIFFLLNLAMFCFGTKRSPWVFVAHATNLVAGIFCCVPILIAAPVLAFWFRPEVKDYYGFR
jgi:hypothetical protein